MKIRQHIPNTITLFNLISGSIAIVQALDGNLHLAAILVGLAAVFDFFDGFAARLLHVKSEIGKELDSLADVISFGLAPGVFLYILLKNNAALSAISPQVNTIIPYLAFLVSAFSALRLAKFNLDTRQTDSFLGLPTPANAIFIISLSLISGKYALQDAGIISVIAGNLWIQLVLIPISCLLLVSEIPLFAMKFSNGFSFAQNKLRYVFLLLSVACLLTLQWAGIPAIILLYILLSLIFRK
ncbi:MAG: CDP-diacylglycerol--serine O-phosphatidyltransferase [Lentimicrobiaceae bacterium]|nr:CDP-diacylglycerol--serine O-phosphatidyltransferase [Lentimicrobiaceae bacterium]MCO5265098.1 CDP-diacylglycerol--serine O-phosphatidyltransferase [Lentimicrobium sp.]HPG33657.1 CDP-diacylglycerol--serine O-phosphatidyltransferase [Lentimicrobium sp.]